MRTTALVLAAMLGVMGVAAAPRMARADDAAEIEKAKREARVLMKAGVDAFTRKDWAQALEMFQAAYTRYPSAKILLNIGSTLRELGRKLEAARAYEKYLQDAQSDPSKRDEVTRLLGDLDKSLGKLRAALSETDATVSLDGNPWDNPTVVMVRVDPGDHQIRAAKAGFVTVELTVAVAAGEEKAIEVTLVAEKAADPTDPDPEVTRVTVRDGVPPEVTDDTEVPPGTARPGRLRAMVRAVIDYKGRGAAATAGIGFAVHDRVELQAAGLLGPNFGLYVGGNLYLMTGKLRPLVALGAPVLFADGVRIAVRGAVGVEWALASRISVTAELGVEHFLNAADDHQATMPVPVVGVAGRL